MYVCVCVCVCQTQVAQHQIIICQGETGSGKTTKIPQFFLDSALLSGGLMIAVTQPRRIAAITVAQRVAEERHVRYCIVV
jgi:HrpA-like RNA helicase